MFARRYKACVCVCVCVCLEAKFCGFVPAFVAVYTFRDVGCGMGI